MHNPVVQVFCLLSIWVFLPSDYCLLEEIPLDENHAFQRLADEQKRICYRHESCQSVNESHMGSGAVEEIPDSSSIECVSADCSCCGSCTCDASCVRYGSCCLDAYKNFDHALDSTQNSRYECVLAQYLPNQDSDFKGKEFRYWMITKCDPSYSNHEERDMCENPWLYESPESVVPVTDLRSNVHYRNKYCYHCSGDGNEASLVTWVLKIVNNESILIPNQNLLGELRNQRGNIFFLKPEYVDAHRCNAPPYKISVCNKTGLWKTNNRYIETACNSVLDPFNYTYKNYFCYLCNIAERLPEENWICRFNRTQGGDTVNPPFFAILDVTAFDGELTRNQLQCSFNQFKDEIMMVCRDVLCHEGRTLKNGACLTSTKIVTNSTCFSAFIKMTPRTNSMSDDNYDDVRMITKHIERSLVEKLWICFAIEQEFVFFTKTDDKRQIKYFVVFIAVYIPVNVTGCKSDMYIDKLISVYSDNITVKDSVHGAISFDLEAAVYNVTLTWNRAYLFVSNMSDSTTTVLETLLYWKIKSPCDLTELTPINKLFSCPFVILAVDEISMTVTVENAFLFLANVETPNKTLKTLSRWEYEIHGDQISICLEDFIELYSILIESQSVLSVHLPPQMAGNSKHSLALACVSLSIVCLFVTIVTYLTNSSLHSQPGIDNVILCIFLLLAQTVYQFGAGQTSLPNSACSLIGATCHLLWLSVMFSINICCIQMFTIFKNPTNTSRMFDSWRTLKHVLFVISSSSLFVVMNMVISLVKTDGVSIGYGGKLCYLSSNLMQAITFVAPSAMTLVVNMFIFAYVVYSIQKVSSAKLLQKERNYLSVYARLSTLTGLTWIFGFFRLVFETEFLEYLFIIFNAGQGVFIMIAFVLNRRVLSLICSKSCITSS